MQECYDGETPVRERGEGAERLGVWADMTASLTQSEGEGGRGGSVPECCAVLVCFVRLRGSPRDNVGQ